MCIRAYHHFLILHLQAVSSSNVTGGTSGDDITEDSRGIAGWDKVGQLAEVLVSLHGIGVSAAQAQRIKSHYDALHAFDKRAIEVTLRSQQPNLRGRFCSQKRVGHTTVEQMRRYIFSTNI